MKSLIELAPKHIKHYSQIVHSRVVNPDHNIRPMLNYNSVHVWVGKPEHDYTCYVYD